MWKSCHHPMYSQSMWKDLKSKVRSTSTSSKYLEIFTWLAWPVQGPRHLPVNVPSRSTSWPPAVDQACRMLHQEQPPFENHLACNKYTDHPNVSVNMICGSKVTWSWWGQSEITSQHLEQKSFCSKLTVQTNTQTRVLYLDHYTAQ